MPDISMCEGVGCEQAETCYRHNAKPSEFRQTYFLGSPLEPDGSCKHYWKDVVAIRKRDGKLA